MLDQQSTDQDDLRSGQAPWQQPRRSVSCPPFNRNLRCEVLVVGAGITGSMLAEALSRDGKQVVIIEREKPGSGSTAASTAMLLWEIDKSLRELSSFYGFEKAARIYRRSFEAVQGLISLIQEMPRIDFRYRNSLLLSAGDVGASELLEEHKLRQKANLPGDYLDHRTLFKEFGFARQAALVSPGSAEADPKLLSHHLLELALNRGAILFQSNATAFDSTSTRAFVEVDSRFTVEADHVVLATGYTLPKLIKSNLHQVTSSWAIATPPQTPSNLWREQALIWEASENYLYARTTSDGRIIVGGEDDLSAITPDMRDAQIPEKASLLLSRLHALWPNAQASAEFKWAGYFGTTKDGLPLLGDVPKFPNFYAAYGYGGNGITFSFLAAGIIRSLIHGNRQAWFDDFALDR